MLGAGMVAAGQVNVDRRVERDPRLEPRGKIERVLLGVRGGELAAGRAGAGDEAGPERVGRQSRPSASIAAFAASTFGRRRPRPAGSATPSGADRRRRSRER